MRPERGLRVLAGGAVLLVGAACVVLLTRSATVPGMLAQADVNDVLGTVLRTADLTPRDQLEASTPLMGDSPQASFLGNSQQGESPGHWGGVGSENYGTPQWDNTGWNAHYHPRDGASMDSESMEPWYWRKGPRVNDEYTGHMADGDPLFSPPDGWEPPINYHDSAYLPEAAPSPAPLLNRMAGIRTNPYSGGGRGAGAGYATGSGLAQAFPAGSQQGESPGHWGGVGSENYGTPQWDNTGWNAHYHPRDGASMDSESMEPWYWRKGPRVNDEYTGHMADGDPLFSPPDGWEPPINYHDSAYVGHGK